MNYEKLWNKFLKRSGKLEWNFKRIQDNFGNFNFEGTLNKFRKNLNVKTFLKLGSQIYVRINYVEVGVVVEKVRDKLSKPWSNF